MPPIGKEQVQTPPPTNTPPAPNFAEFAGQGFEGHKQADFQVPFLSIVQDLSPAVKKNDGGYVEGAEPGMIMNSVTKRLYDVFQGGKGANPEPLLVIPVHFVKVWTEWNKRKFVKHHGDAGILAETTKGGKKGFDDVLKNGNYIVETAMHSVFVVENLKSMSMYPALVSLNKTQLKKSRVWNSLMAGIKLRDNNGNEFTPPPYSHIYRVTTVPEQNEEGSWAGWKFSVVGAVPTVESFQKTRTFALELNANPTLALPNGAPDSEVDEHEASPAKKEAF